MLLLVPVVAAALSAPVITDVCNSAARPGQPVEINADCSQPPAAGTTTATLFWAGDTATTWQRLELGRAAQPGYESTFTGLLIAPASGSVRYYVRASSGSNWSTQSPFNTENQWPPAAGLLAATADEPAGDASDPEGPWLDLTGAFVGYSASHFYAALTNNHTSWPTYTFPQPWYIYSIGFVNPEARSDTWAFALSYASIPGVYTTGLYAINRYANSYERVADAEAATSGNRLSLRCPIASFAGDPRFGPWPNQSGFLTVAANTQAIYPIGGNRLRDTTASALFYANRSPRFVVGVNAPPQLSGPRVLPAQGTPETEFWFSVSYSDPDTNLPRRRALIVDGETLNLVPTRHGWGSWVLFYRYRSGFGLGTHYFRCLFDDGAATVVTPVDSFSVIGTGLNAAPVPAAPLPLTITPNPCRGRTLVSGPRPGDGSLPDLLVFDPTGRQVRRSPAAPAGERLLFHLDKLRPGVYLLQLTGRVGTAARLTVQ